MSSAHADPEYQRNARRVRAKVRADHKAGRAVYCQRCGREIQPTQTFDVGHRIDHSRGGSHALDNLGPEHRNACNRRAGGRLGAQKTNQARGVSRAVRRLPTW
ncbi:HNH endonuclease [uncultured Microbacterium sp.]|uniref:HNH endonuclease n=1 Tax=uncultured Microbacterium sp. TaxID=191216 RepID=UPI0037DC6A9F